MTTNRVVNGDDQMMTLSCHHGGRRRVTLQLEQLRVFGVMVHSRHSMRCCGRCCGSCCGRCRTR
eukprot:279240-Chlamydomonas_euryale.AAC.1